MERIMQKLGHNRGEKLQYLNKRICGLWLIWVSVTILVSAIFGGTEGLKQAIFYPGYAAGFIFILGNKALYRKFSFGRPSRFQKNMTLVSIVAMFVLMVLISGQYFQVHDFRMIWLGAFLAIAIHFLPFSFVHGKSMLIIAIPLTVNALVGIFIPNIPFINIAVVDAVVKFLFGIILFYSREPRNLSKSKQEAC